MSFTGMSAFYFCPRSCDFFEIRIIFSHAERFSEEETHLFKSSARSCIAYSLEASKLLYLGGNIRNMSRSLVVPVASECIEGYEVAKEPPSMIRFLVWRTSPYGS